MEETKMQLNKSKTDLTFREYDNLDQPVVGSIKTVSSAKLLGATIISDDLKRNSCIDTCTQIIPYCYPFKKNTDV